MCANANRGGLNMRWTGLKTSSPKIKRKVDFSDCVRSVLSASGRMILSCKLKDEQDFVEVLCAFLWQGGCSIAATAWPA